jgi:hypothetical protein
MLDHILNGVRSVGHKASPSLVARQSGHGIGGRAVHRFTLRQPPGDIGFLGIRRGHAYQL